MENLLDKIAEFLKQQYLDANELLFDEITALQAKRSDLIGKLNTLPDDYAWAVRNGSDPLQLVEDYQENEKLHTAIKMYSDLIHQLSQEYGNKIQAYQPELDGIRRSLSRCIELKENITQLQAGNYRINPLYISQFKGEKAALEGYTKDIPDNLKDEIKNIITSVPVYKSFDELLEAI